MNDAELLREFVKHHSDAAFAGLVKNYVNLVANQPDLKGTWKKKTNCIMIQRDTASLRAGEIHDAATVGDLAKVKTLLASDPTLLESKDNTLITEADGTPAATIVIQTR